MKLKPTLFVANLLVIMFFMLDMSFATTYYIRPSGNNTKNGTSPTTAWLNLTNVNSKVFVAGDIIYLEQGFTYTGNIYFDPSDGGTAANPVIVTSWNPNGAITGRATINSGTNTAFYAYNSGGIKITDLNLIGSTSANDGVAFYCDLAGNAKKDYVYIENVDVQGYKNGLGLGSWAGTAGYTNVTIRNSIFHDNVRTGLATYAQGRLSHLNVNVSYCKAYNNFGDLTVTTTNTGSGIILSGVDGGKIDHCIAYNNGQNNRNTGGGPVGIWCYEANNVIIEYNESYDNDAGLNLDGGGFDIDGGSTNCIMQYNYSHNNEGPGYLFAQFQGSSVTMNNNICRYNLSVNDARKNTSGAIYFWAAGGFSITNTYVYGNTIYVTPSSGTASGIYISAGTNTTNTQINNNLIVTTGGVKPVYAASTTGINFRGNCYWPSGGTFSINWGGTNYSSLSSFQGSGQETGTGLQLDPMLKGPYTGITIGNTDNLATLKGFQLQAGSPMINAGVTITSPGSSDYYGNTVPLNTLFDIGAHELLEDPVMPISLNYFTAKKQLNINIITWQTSTEINNSYYELQRSFNATDFTSIHTQKSKGNNNILQNYSYNDNYYTDSTIYYRLKQTDLDGNFSYSQTITIQPKLKDEISIYPNPATNEVHFLGLKSESLASLYSLEGKNICSQKINNNTFKVPMEVKNGMYILNIKTIEGLIHTTKISIIR